MPDDATEPQTFPDLNPGDLLARAMNSAPASGSVRGWVPPSVEQLQRALPQYDILALAGRGGMGAVYKGWQKSLDRHVAIKVLPVEAAQGDADFAERFKREAKAMARLSHPGIVTVFDAGQTADGLLYFVMDFIEGTDVQQMVASRGRLPPEEALAITASVLDALAYAHGKGIIHRDIKPSNVMVDPEGHVKVADFGLAKITTPGSSLLTASDVMMGTPEFMAPEALTGTAHVDHRADLYAVGVMLYQMLTGQLPRGRFDPPSRVVPGLDRRLDGIVDKALQTDRTKRYASAIEVKAVVEPILTRTLARRTAIVRHAGKKSRRPVLIAVSVILAVAGGVLWKNTRSTKPAASAREPKAPAPPATLPSPPAAKKLAGAEATATASAAAEAPEPVRGPDGRMRFPVGVWTRLRDRETDAREISNHPDNPNYKQDGPWLRLGQGTYGWLDRDVTFMTNLGIRARFRGQRVKDSDYPQMNLRGGGSNTKLALNLFINSGKVIIRTTEPGYPVLAAAPLQEPLPAGKEYDMEFYAIGARVFARVNGQLLTATTQLPPDPGNFAIYGAGMDYFKDAQVLNLDGLSEAEALKRAGVAAAPPPQWIDVPLKSVAPADLGTKAEYLGDKLHLWSFGNGWRPLQGKRLRNAAQRITFTWLEKTNAIGLNYEDGSPDSAVRHHFFKLSEARHGGHFWAVGYYEGNAKTLKQVNAGEPIPVGQVVILQYAVIGDKHYGWFNGKLLGPVDHSVDPQGGEMWVQVGDIVLDRYEYIDLDGLSEADARKALDLPGK